MCVFGIRRLCQKRRSFRKRRLHGQLGQGAANSIYLKALDSVQFACLVVPKKRQLEAYFGMPEVVMKINRDNMKWAARFMLVVLLAGVADVLVVMFAQRPMPWAAIIPALTPLLVATFVILPMNRAEKR